MELAYLSEVRDDALVLREVDGDTDAYGGVRPGFTPPARDARGATRWSPASAPQLVTDAERDAAGGRRIRSSPRPASAPTRACPCAATTAALLGTLCCLSRSRSRSSTSATCATSTCSRGWPRSRLDEAEARAAAPPRRGRGGRRPGAAGRAQRARELHRRALRGGAGAGARGRAGAGPRGRGRRPPSARSRCCTTSARSACPTRSCRSRARSPRPSGRSCASTRRSARRSSARSARSRTSRPAVRAEHERWDGGGYPDGLAGEDVPLASRICFVCDAWHAMTSDRPYRRALSPDQARDGAASATPARSSARSTVAALDARARPRRRAAVEAPARRPLAAQSPLPRVRPDRPLEAELRALITISSAVAGAHRFEDVLDIVGEQACRVLHAAGISISRWEPDQDLHAHARRTRASSTRARRRRPENETWTLTALDRMLVQERAAVRDRARPRRAARRGARRSSSASAAAPRSPRRSASAAASGACSRPTRPSTRRRSPTRTCASPRRCARRWRRRSAARELFSRLEDARLPGPAHAAAEPPRARRADGGRGRATARANGARPRAGVLRPRRAQGRQRPATATTPATARSWPRARRSSRPPRAFPGAMTCRLGGDEFCVLLEGHGRRRRAAARARRRPPAGRRARRARSRSPAASPASTTSTAAPATSSARPTRRSTRPSGSAATSCSSPSRASRRRARRRRSRGRGGASATPGPHEREALVRFLLERSTPTCAAPASSRGSRPWPTRSPRPSTPRAGRSPAARRAHPTCETLLGAERRDRYDDGRARHALHRARRDLRARRLPAHRRGDGATAAASRSTPPTRAPTRDERALLAQWGFTAVTAAAAIAPDGVGMARRAVLRPRAPTRCRPRCPSCGCWPARRSGAGPAPGYDAAGDVAREELEDLDVAAQVGVRVQHGQRPLLVDARRHEHAVVHVVEPRELGQRVVDLREVVAVLADRLRRHHDAALRAHADRVRGEAVAAMTSSQPAIRSALALLQLRVGRGREHLEQRRLRRRPSRAGCR